uniref:Uncharacterized protein n=1 Tax=Avena sativa TaxID=4498 RepID=A0ACD5UV60_AVESA
MMASYGNVKADAFGAPASCINETCASQGELTAQPDHPHIARPKSQAASRECAHTDRVQYSSFTTSSIVSLMANFAAQLKDRFLGLVDRVAGCGRPGGVKEATGASATKPAPLVQEHVEIRPRGPNVSGGSGAGVN